jgi:muramoyltetrapeptide carboxypeptidase
LARAFAPVSALRPGDSLRIIAPAGPFDGGALARGAARLRARYDVRVGEGIDQRRGYLAGDDTRRLDELFRALEEPDIKALVCARGGYGTMRLLDRLPHGTIRRAGKLLVGFSDVTALHATWALSGLRSLHAPMAASLADASDAAFERWVAALEGALPSPFPVEPLVPGTAEGPLLGGNLAILAALVGTPYFPPVDGAILFLEDVGERPYRIDRMLTQLRLAGAFARVAGVAVGRFTGCEPGADGTTVDDVLREHLGRLAVPVVLGVPTGHVADNAPLPLGGRARIDAARGELELLEPAALAPENLS